MKYLYFFLATFLATTVYTQSLEQIVHYGNSGQETPFSIVVDSEGSVITTGQILDTCSLDPLNPQLQYISNGDVDIYVSKIDSNGVFQWGHSFGNISGDAGSFVTIDPNGNICVFGNFKHTVDFDPGIGVAELSSNYSEGFFLKLDTDGNFISVQKLSNQRPMDAVFDSNGNMYLTGRYFVPSSQSSTDLDPGTGVALFTSEGGEDIYISKFDPSGQFIWAGVFGSCANDPGGKVTLSPNEQFVYIGGAFCNSAWSASDYSAIVDVDPTTGTQNVDFSSSGKSYLTKLSSQGDFIWCNTGSDYLVDFKCDPSGNIYTVGTINGPIDVDPSAEEYIAFSYYMGSYVNKFSDDGTFIWNKIFDGSDGYYGGARNIEIDNQGNILMVGYSSGDLIAFPDVSGFTLEENYPGIENKIHLIKLNSQGHVVWGKLFEAIWGHLYPTDMAILSEGSLYMTGYFSKADFDNMNPNGIIECFAGSVDAFLVKLNGCPDYTIETYTVCDSLTWIDGITYYNSNNTATYNLLSETGCDSTIQLNLTVLHADSLNANIITLPTNGSFPYGAVVADINEGVPNYLVVSDIEDPSFVNQNYVGTGYSEGLYDLHITDQCGNQIHAPFIIVADSNYQFNNSFLDSLFSDTLGYLMENCVIDYSSIDSAYIDSVILNGSNVMVIWNIIDNSGTHIDTTEYLIQNPNGFGTYVFQLSLYCSTKSTDQFYTANDAYFLDGLPIGGELNVLESEYYFKISLVPNPTHSDVSIYFEGENGKLKLVDSQGKVLTHIDGITNGQKISLEKYQAGLYYFLVETTLGTAVKKLIKE